MAEAQIVNVAPDDRMGPIWEIQRRDSREYPWHRDFRGSSNGTPAQLRALAAREGRTLVWDQSS
jgi:hypothetical protein